MQRLMGAVADPSCVTINGRISELNAEAAGDNGDVISVLLKAGIAMRCRNITKGTVFELAAVFGAAGDVKAL